MKIFILKIPETSIGIGGPGESPDIRNRNFD